MIIISLDYDKTYSLAPEFWLNVIKTAPHNFKFYCVTMRWEGEAESMDPRLKDLIEIIFTARQAKRPFCDKLGISIDIWIDDAPEAITTDFL